MNECCNLPEQCAQPYLPAYMHVLQGGIARVTTLTCESLQGHSDTYASPANLLSALCRLHRLHNAASRLLWQLGLSASAVTGQWEWLQWVSQLPD
jgi:hypothetical protein